MVFLKYALEMVWAAREHGGGLEAAGLMLKCLPLAVEAANAQSQQRPGDTEANNDDETPAAAGAAAAAAAEMAYMLALELYRAGDDKLADVLLRELGCQFRLATAILARDAPSLEPNPPSPVAPRVFEDALPGALLRALQCGFADDSVFWQEHQYLEPETPFFSYFYSLADKPETALEACMHLLASQLGNSLPANMWQDVTSVEWWAHTRQPGEPHQLHFDLDETRLRLGQEHYACHHPVCSSILYLSGCGGPTVVLNQTPADMLAPEAWLVHPWPGQLTAFNGNLLHGVLPGGKHQAGSRTTLVLAWWAAGRRPAPGPPGGGPARNPPWRQPTSLQQPVTTAQPASAPSLQPADPMPQQQSDAAACFPPEPATQPAEPTWPTLFAWPEAGISSAQAMEDATPLQASAASPQHVSPAWVPVPGADAGGGTAAAAHRRKRARLAQKRLPLPPLRFFLTSETEIRDVYGG